jgi:nifR3 family TIM-barrel protein
MEQMKTFWQAAQDKASKEKRPIVMVAPMADVTDIAFRTMIAKYSRMGDDKGGPDVMWNEFVSADGLNSPGREVLKRDLAYGEGERPIIAQLFTDDVENMVEAVKLCRELGFDGVDINMGCPVNNIGKQGAGAELINTPEVAVALIRAAQSAALDMPVSVKTRIGFNKIEYKDWLSKLLACNIPALTIHLRTKKEMSLVPAHWELATEIYEFCKSVAPETIIIMNGDVKSLKEAQEKYEQYKIDGVMIGRGVFGTPWFFDWEMMQNRVEKTLKEKFEIMLEHTKLYEDTVGKYKSFAIMKKHYKAYVNGFDGASDLRVRLFECENYTEVETIMREHMKKNNIV